MGFTAKDAKDAKKERFFAGTAPQVQAPSGLGMTGASDHHSL